jgi:hypothetical protein
MSRISIAAGLAALIAAGVFISAPVRAESVMKECGKEWSAAKEAKTQGTQTWPEFLKDCKTRHAAAAPAAAPAPAPTPTPTPTKMSKAAPESAGAGEFKTEGEAKGHCPTDTVVWVNTKSHKYHYAGHRSYGTTKHGAYMCETDAKAAGDIGAKGEKPKG